LKKRFMVAAAVWSMSVLCALASVMLPVASAAPAGVPVSSPGLFTSMAQSLSTATGSAVIAGDAGGRLWRYPGDGAGGFASRHQIGVGWNAMTAILTPGDVTGDGQADVLGRDPAGGLWLTRATAPVVSAPGAWWAPGGLGTWSPVLGT